MQQREGYSDASLKPGHVMRYKHGLVEVEAEGMGESRDFGIALSAKVFRSLIDNLYSRKIEAGIRELSTNAFDAHIKAGIIRPFHVHLPTTLEPVFRIRDYGCSMTHELVMVRYTTLGDSTKDGSDEEVGMLGYGSKSPFAYTDAFSLVCWLDGEKRTYAIYIGPNGRPRCSLVGSEPTDEETGVAVEFPVKLADLAEFETAAIRVFKGFPLLPEGLPETAMKKLAVQPFETGSFWKAYSKEYLGGGFFARQGCVLYPIDLKHILPADQASGFSSVNASIILDFPIGSLEFVNSREFLSYDPDTVKALKHQFSCFRDYIEDKLEAELAGAKTLWDRRAIIGTVDLFSTFGGLFKHTYLMKDVAKLPSIVENMMPRRRGEENVFFSYIKKNEYIAYSKRDASYPSSSLPSKIVFVYRDRNDKGKIPVGANTRIVKYLNDNDLDAAFTLNSLSIADWRRMGKPKVLRLSDLPAPPRPTYAGTGGTGGGGFFARWKVPSERSNYLIDADKEDTEGCLFAFMNRGSTATPPDQPHYDVKTILWLSRMLKKFTGREIAFINIRSNEPYDKFPESEFPRFYGCEKDILAALSKVDIINAINVYNRGLFEHSIYDDVLNNLPNERNDASNPLLALRRFHHRVDQMPDDAANIWDSVMDSRNPFGSFFRDHIIERAISMKLEVLPPREYPFHGGRPKRFPYPLLSNKWEKIVNCLNEPRNYRIQIMEGLSKC